MPRFATIAARRDDRPKAADLFVRCGATHVPGKLWAVVPVNDGAEIGDSPV